MAEIAVLVGGTKGDFLVACGTETFGLPTVLKIEGLSGMAVSIVLFLEE